MKDEILVTVLIDLAGICKKLADNWDVPEDLRARAAQFVAEFNALLPVRGRGTPDQHFAGERLIIKISRFLPRLLEV